MLDNLSEPERASTLSSATHAPRKMVIVRLTTTTITNCTGSPNTLISVVPLNNRRAQVKLYSSNTPARLLLLNLTLLHQATSITVRPCADLAADILVGGYGGGPSDFH